MILLDITRLLNSISKGETTGIDRVELKYYCHIVKSYANYQLIAKFRQTFYLIDNNKFQISITNYLCRDVKNANSHYKTKNVLKSHWFEKEYLYYKFYRKMHKCCISLGLKHFIKKEKGRIVYVNVSHLNFEDDFLLAFLKKNKVIIICMLHDIIPITHPQFCNYLSYSKHEYRVLNMIDVANVIICNSYYTKKVFLEYIEKNKKIFMGDIRVLQLGTEKLLQDTNTSDLNLNNILSAERYFLILGTIEPRKNHILILEIWMELLLEMGDDCPQLYIVGKRGWQTKEFFDKLNIFKSKSKGLIKEFNDIGDTQLGSFIKNATCLLNPTFIEGWGMPITEALSLNIPVICSDLEVLRESGQDLAIYIEVGNKDKWKNAILDVYYYNDKHKSNIESFCPVDWNDHFDCLDHFVK